MIKGLYLLKRQDNHLKGVSGDVPLIILSYLQLLYLKG